jgi:hypothetical protein
LGKRDKFFAGTPDDRRRHVMAAAAVTFATLLWFRETYRTPFVGSSSGTAAYA